MAFLNFSPKINNAIEVATIYRSSLLPPFPGSLCFSYSMNLQLPDAVNPPWQKEFSPGFQKDPTASELLLKKEEEKAEVREDFPGAPGRSGMEWFGSSRAGPLGDDRGMSGHCRILGLPSTGSDGLVAF